jgi:hypothetical protein
VAFAVTFIVPETVPLATGAVIDTVGGAVSGELVTVKFIPLLAMPATLTTTFPVVAPLGIGVTMPVPLQLVGFAVVPLNVTMLVPWVDPKLVPPTVTGWPTPPDPGFTCAMYGAVLAVLVPLGLNAATIAPHGSDDARETPADNAPLAA